MTTKFKSITVDLSNTFLAYTSGTKAAVTGYKVNGVDLQHLYQMYTSGTKASVTGYKVNGVDLNNLFSPKAVSKSFNTFGTGASAGITSGIVRAVAVDSTGKYYVSGDVFIANGVRFTYANGAGGIGQLTSLLNVNTAFAQGVVDTPNAIAVDMSDNIYTAGWFNSIGPNLNHVTGQITQTSGIMIAKWNGTVWTSASGLGSGTNGNIQKLAVSKVTLGVFYVVGSITITYLNGASTSANTNFAKWTGSAWQTLSFSPVTSPITRIDVDASENIYIINGTDISSYNGTSWTNLTKNNSGGTAVISGTISDVFVDANNILWAVGTFFVASYSRATGFWTYIGTPGFTPTRVHGAGGVIYVIGTTGFASYSGSFSGNLITSITGQINQLYCNGSKVMIGGTFTMINGVTRNRIATYE